MQKHRNSATKFQQDALHGIQAGGVPNATLCMERRRGEADLLHGKCQPGIESLLYHKSSKPAQAVAMTYAIDHEFTPQVTYNARLESWPISTGQLDTHGIHQKLTLLLI